MLVTCNQHATFLGNQENNDKFLAMHDKLQAPFTTCRTILNYFFPQSPTQFPQLIYSTLVQANTKHLFSAMNTTCTPENNSHSKLVLVVLALHHIPPPLNINNNKNKSDTQLDVRVKGDFNQYCRRSGFHRILDKHLNSKVELWYDSSDEALWLSSMRFSPPSEFWYSWLVCSSSETLPLLSAAGWSGAVSSSGLLDFISDGRSKLKAGDNSWLSTDVS